MNQYEAMFLFDPTFGNSFEKCEAEVRRLMERAEAELVFCSKWDERRLAYKIKGRKRGVYVLTCFNARSDKIVGLERDAKISEDILRLLVLRADEATPEILEQACAARGEERSIGSTDAEAPTKEATRPVLKKEDAKRDETGVPDTAKVEEAEDSSAPKPESSILE